MRKAKGQKKRECDRTKGAVPKGVGEGSLQGQFENVDSSSIIYDNSQGA